MKPFECTPLAARPITRITGGHARGVDDAVALDDAEREAREVEVVGAVHVGQLGRLAAEQRAARLAAAVRDPLDEIGDAVGIEPADGDVVEEQRGLGAAGDHVVDAHRDEVDARVAQPAGRALQHQLRAHAVGAGDEHGIAVAARRDEPGEAAEVAQHARRARRGDGSAHAVDDGVGGLQRDTGLGVGQWLGRGHARAGSRSKRSLLSPGRLGHRHRIVARQARAAEAVGRALDRELQPLEREVGQRVGAEVLADLVEAALRRDQLVLARHVDAVVAGRDDRRRRDAQVHLARAAVAQHLHDLARRRAAHDRVVDDHEPLARDHVRERVELEPHAVVAQRLVGLDERAPDVAVLDQAVRERSVPMARA